MNRYTVGDRIVVRATLVLNGAPDLGTIAGATITAALSLPDRSGRAAGTSVVTATIITGATVEAVWPSAQTGGIVPGRYLAEFQASVGGEPVTYERFEIEIEAGVVP